MLMASINAPPRPARPMVGKLYRVSKVESAGYSNKPPDDKPLALTTIANGCWNLTDGIQNYTIKNTSVLTSLLKVEADKLRREMAGKFTTSPVGKGGGWHVGSDPEVFAVNGSGGVIPAFNYLPSKKAPILQSNDTQRVFYDGFQAEFTACQSTCHEVLVTNIRPGLITALARAKALDKTARLTYRCVVDLTDEIMATATAEQIALGCEPSKNAYTDEENPRLREVDATTLPFRFAGFHIHYGCGNQSKGCFKRMVRMLDAVSGVVSVSLFRGMEDERRRWYYGLAGEYRLPSHGLEWRVLSSAVLCHPGITHLMLDISRVAARLAYQGFSFLWDASEEEVRDTINTLNLEQSQAILKRNEKALNFVLQALYGERAEFVTKAQKLIHQGAMHCLDVEDLGTNWYLEALDGPRRFREMVVK